MIDHLDALIALAETGTMTRAAARLRVTQSAVSKRIAVLEARLGLRLVEPHGRRVRLTADGARILDRTRGPMADLRAALSEEASVPRGVVSIGVSESVLASWGAEALSRAIRDLPGLDLQLAAHRSPVAVDRVRSGELLLALVSGLSDSAPDLASEVVREEPMVLVPSALRRKDVDLAGGVDVLTIEPVSATWRALSRRLGHLQREAGVALRVGRTLESFACVVQCARAGFGHGLVPEGIARAMGVESRRLVRLPPPGLTRPVSLVARPATLSIPLVAALREALLPAVRRRHGG